MKKTIDVLIPVYKPDHKFRQLLERLGKQTLLPGNVILMVTIPEGMIPEEALSEVRDLAKETPFPVLLEPVRKEDFDHGGTRNKGMQLSEADYVICMTQDAVPADTRLLESLIAPFEMGTGEKEGHEILISYGRQLPCRDAGPIERFTRSFNYPRESRIKTIEDLDALGIKTFFASDVCAAYRRESYLARGGFPERTIFNEDMIFAGRAVRDGYAIAYAAEARVYHSHNLGIFEQFHRNFDLAVSQKQTPEVFGGVRSEGEGIRLVKETAAFLIRSGNGFRIPELVLVSGFKYLGYFLGKRYEMLPEKFVEACSMNKRWWRTKGREDK